MEEKLSYRNTVRLFAGEKCFGPGVAQLLRHVQEFHSLRSAAKAMNMAYSKAWTIVKSSERILGVQLLHTSVGGRSGGGAQLTEEAVRLSLSDFNTPAQIEKLAQELHQLFRETVR